MQAGVSAGEGSDDQAASNEDREDDSASSARSGVPLPAAWAAEAVSRHERMVGPAIDLINSLDRFAETTDYLSQQAQVYSQLQKSAEYALQVTPPLEEVLRSTSALSGAESKIASHVAVYLRGLDQLTAGPARYAEYAETARWAEQAVGFGALTSWRISLQADSQIEQLLKSVADAAQPDFPLYLELSRIGRSQASLTDWVVQQDATSRLLGKVSGLPLIRWRDYVGRLSADPTVRSIRASVLSGQAGLSLLSADLLTSGAEDTELAEASASRIEADVLLPWEEGRLKLGRDLRERLGKIDPSVPELLAGAWDDLERNGPAAVEKAAHCITEVLDRTLRAAAPDAEVRDWHKSSGRPATEWEGQDMPPHALRVKFLAQRLGSERTVVEAQFESLASLHKVVRSRLQASKHASRGDLAAIRVHD